MKRYIVFISFGFLFLTNLLSQKEDSVLAIAQNSPSESLIHIKGKRLVKRSWSLGGTLSAKSQNFSDMDLLVVDVENFSQSAFNLRLEGSYFVKENLSAGLGLQFGEGETDLSANLLDKSYARTVRNFSRSYGALGFIKNYIPASSSYILYITNQTELYYSYKSGPSETYIGDVLERKYAEKHSIGVGIRPGILIFFTESFAFDLNMGLLGFSHSEQNVTYEYPPNNPPSENNRKESSRNRLTDLTLKFDLLRIGFGFSYYF